MEAAVGAPSTTLRRIPNRSRCTPNFWRFPRPTAIAIAMAKPQSSPSVSASSNSKRVGTIVFPVGEPGPRTASPTNGPPTVKLLTRVEQLRLLTKAEKAGLLSAAEKLGFSLSTIEQLGLLSKAEELGVLSAATNPATPATLRTLSLALLAVGPAFVYLVPEDFTWELALQAVVALLCVIGGSAAFAASSLVYDLQKS